MTIPNYANDLLAPVTHNILQPPLRPVGENERIVRTAGLKFIVPMNWKPGDVLDETSAALLNTAFCTAAINRFSPIRKALLENPDCTYDDIANELQDYFETFKYNPRTVDSSKPEDTRSAEVRELEAFARPYFNKAWGGGQLPRKEYETLLREWIDENTEFLTTQFEVHKASVNSLVSDLTTLFGND